jgi:hypothetical protein
MTSMTSKTTMTSITSKDDDLLTRKMTMIDKQRRALRARIDEHEQQDEHDDQ